MTDFETIARQRLYFVHDSDRLERRRLPERNRFAEGVAFLFGLIAAVCAAYFFAAFVFSVG